MELSSTPHCVTPSPLRTLLTALCFSTPPEAEATHPKKQIQGLDLTVLQPSYKATFSYKTGLGKALLLGEMEGLYVLFQTLLETIFHR